MKCLDSNAIPDLECPMCNRKVKASFFSGNSGEEKFHYEHICHVALTNKDFKEKCQNYQMEQK